VRFDTLSLHSGFSGRRQQWKRQMASDALRRALLALATGLCFLCAVQGQSQPRAEALVSASNGYWTVLTMAPDGSWGAATESLPNHAIANAIAECKFMSRKDIGCGAYLAAIQYGWTLGLRCGNENIIATAMTLASAERAAARRELELRKLYVPNMPACRRVVTIDPRGKVVVPDARHLSSQMPRGR
jgi:hypothetical protein